MNKKILVLDDDRDILEMVSFILEDGGYEIQTLTHGEGVLDAISEFKPDLVLMDVMLANLDGRLVCQQIKNAASTHHLPVILISGTHDLASSLDQPGAPNDFVPKPFDIDFLLNKISNSIAG